ncbi:hypothetical protein CBS101457_000546 [Exobasidium rhododendri]|nr:hypothetical protein CBS101457_000546 [Exobasidium rhododendri]
METSTSSQPSLDARQLAAQLPPGFPRGDEAAIDAVMQLAAFTEQQERQQEQQDRQRDQQQHHHHHHQHHPQQQQHAPSQSSDQMKDVRGDEQISLSEQQQQQQQPQRQEDSKVEDEMLGKKRRGDSIGRKGSPAKIPRESERQDTAAHHQNWASFTGQNNEFEQLLHPNGDRVDDDGTKEQNGQQLNHDLHQQQLQQDQDAADAETSMEGDLLTRHGRPLSSTKRAAQNRAAQRAFRERRDQHVKEVEAKAKQVDEALATAELHKQRYEELLGAVAEIRAENKSLRMAIFALGGTAPEVTATTSLPDTMEREIDIPPHSFDEGRQEDIPNEGHGDSHLDGLSAVAAAAAAAAAALHSVRTDDDTRQNGEGKESQT